ncbi:hypothetical protein MN608_10989 [Microdochium nivale]|nr:hypothetical protein MN608_10989 [Microdochium nivale]
MQLLHILRLCYLAGLGFAAPSPARDALADRSPALDQFLTRDFLGDQADDRARNTLLPRNGPSDSLEDKTLSPIPWGQRRAEAAAVAYDFSSFVSTLSTSEARVRQNTDSIKKTLGALFRHEIVDTPELRFKVKNRYMANTTAELRAATWALRRTVEALEARLAANPSGAVLVADNQVSDVMGLTVKIFSLMLNAWAGFTSRRGPNHIRPIMWDIAQDQIVAGQKLVTRWPGLMRRFSKVCLESGENLAGGVASQPYKDMAAAYVDETLMFLVTRYYSWPPPPPPPPPGTPPPTLDDLH